MELQTVPDLTDEQLEELAEYNPDELDDAPAFNYSPFRIAAAVTAALADYNDLLENFPEEGILLEAGSDALAILHALAEGAATFGTVTARVGQDLQHLHGFIEANLQQEN